jgi:hypothetical protein
MNLNLMKPTWTYKQDVESIANLIQTIIGVIIVVVGKNSIGIGNLH